MKIAPSFLLCALLLGATTAQECPEITEQQIRIVLINEFNTTGVISEVDVIDFNINCLASGCTFGMYRSLTVTVSFEFEVAGSRLMSVFQIDIDCIFDDGKPDWARTATTDPVNLVTPSEIAIRFNTPTLTNCTECNRDQGDGTFHCVGTQPRVVMHSCRYVQWQIVMLL